MNPRRGGAGAAVIAQRTGFGVTQECTRARRPVHLSVDYFLTGLCMPITALLN